MISAACNTIFEKCIMDYHLNDDVDAGINNSFDKNTIAHLLYLKCWIDTVQWHLEDIVRNPAIDPVEGLSLKRRIDASNQYRTDIVESIDNHFLEEYKLIEPKSGATQNTESPAWAIDRLSILALKIYHMNAEVNRLNAGESHRHNCMERLYVLREQKKDLSKAIDDLLNDIASGRKIMKVYRQMKMYNDPALNPVLYHQTTK